ncbi:HAD family hydrolase [Paenibacillus sp. GSMTC-2017]|uniref:HAD family hydrolase n=1 Tax=Paenibacillus sp. GSMTC-2017 TaxID=2794350 RepID=UPI002FBD6D5A
MGGIKGIIFDFDGTLADTMPLVFTAFYNVFKDYDGRLLSDQEIASYFGPSETEVIKLNLNNKESIKDAISTYYDVYTRNHDQYVKENVEIIELLKELKGREYQLGIFTGKGKKSLEISLSQLNMSEYFDHIITSDDVSEPKPNSEGMYQLLGLMDCSPEEVIMIGDSDADIAAAQSVEMKSVGVHWFKNNVFNINPDYELNQISEFHKTGIL